MLYEKLYPGLSKSHAVAPSKERGTTSTMPNTDEQILQELRKMSRLMAVTSMRDLTQRERIEILASAEFAPKEIAELVGTTANTVSVELSRLRRMKRIAKRGRATYE